MPEQESYEIIPVTPLKKLEQRMEKIEESGTVPQLQILINQIVELIRNNQKIVNDVIRANTELRNEVSKLPPKLDELIGSMKNFISLIEVAGREEVSAPSAESLKPISQLLEKMVEQNQKLLEGNEAVIQQLDDIGKKLRSGGTPISRVLSPYPGIRFRREVK